MDDQADSRTGQDQVLTCVEEEEIEEPAPVQKNQMLDASRGHMAMIAEGQPMRATLPQPVTAAASR